MEHHRISPQVYFALLSAAGVTLADVARKLGVSRPAVSQWRMGVRQMEEAHYHALADFALSFETRFLSIHRAANQPSGIASPEDGTRLYVAVSPDYPEQMARAFQTHLAELVKLTSGDSATWDYKMIRAYSEDISGIARVLDVIAAERKETEACPDSTRAVEGSK